MEDIGYCNYCGAPSKFICQRCSDSYCCVKCQVDDWPKHRILCFPMPKLVERVAKGVVGEMQKKLDNKDTGSRRNSQEFLEKPVEVERRPRMPSKVLEIPRPPKIAVENEEQVAEEIGLITSLIAIGMNNFVGKLGSILTENLFTIIVEFPDILSEKYDTLMQDLNKEADGFADGQVERGLMIAVQDATSKYHRALVIAFDLEASACVIFLCDLGTFDIIMPTSVKVCPNKYLQLPGRAIIVELVLHVAPDRKKIITDFYDTKNILSFDIKKKRKGIYSGNVNLNGKDAGQVCIHEAIPSLSMCNIPNWTIQIPSQTVVKVIRIKIDAEIHAWIMPIDRTTVYDTLLHTIGMTLEFCKTIPDKNSIVVHVQGQRGGRLLVTKHISQDLVEICDLDNGRQYKCEWNQLKVGNDFIRNLPVFGMNVTLADVPNVQSYEKQGVQEYLSSIDYRSHDYVLSYAGYSAFGVKLMKDNESLGDMIEKHFKAKKDAIEELTLKQKEREAEEIKQRKMKEESERKKAAKQEEERRMKEKEAAEAKEIQLKKAAEEEERQKQLKNEEETIEPAKIAPKVALLNRLQQLKLKTEQTKYFLKDLNPIPLEIGKTSKFIITDPGKDGIIGVCEDTKENNQFLQEILTKVAQYIAKVNIKDLTGYCPDVDEVCLTRFSDDEWYRATCLSSNSKSLTMILIDFGTIYNTKPSEVMPLPEELKEPPPRTHVVLIDEKDYEKVSQLEIYGKYRFKVASFSDEMYTLVFV